MKEKKLFIIGVFFIFGLSCLSHFLFKWSNYSLFISYLSPVNESLFQHAKMFFYPCVFYYFLTAFLYKVIPINLKKWAFLPIIVFLTTFVIVYSTYYFFDLIFHVKSMIIDIVSLFVGICLGNLFAYLIYKSKGSVYLSPTISLIVIVGITIIFTSWTIKPPKEDFFYDYNNQTYQEVYE